MRKLRAVLFDLDDTLFDHTASARAGTLAWQARFEVLDAVPTDELEATNRETLEAVHLQLLAGEVTLDEARAIRTRRIFARYGMTLDDAETAEVHAHYRAAYQRNRGLVPGCLEVLDALAAVEGLALAVVTNNLVEEQIQKLDLLGLAHRFEQVVISEAIGITKPDPRIFAVALERLGVGPEEAVMVGDSFRSDVEGAEAAGIRAVWLDRFGESTASEARSVLQGWKPLEAALEAILGSAW